MRKFITTMGLAAVLAAGGLAVAVLNPIQGASAKSTPPATASASPAAKARPGIRGAAAHVVKKALDGLVTKGTITADQEKAIEAAIKAEAKAELQQFKAKHPNLGKRKARIVGAGKVVASAIGITPQQLAAGLKAGQSIADQATAHHVPVATVEKAIVDAATKKVDAAVSAHKLTAAQGAKITARLPQLAARIVNAKPGRRGGLGRFGRLRGLRPGG